MLVGQLAVMAFGVTDTIVAGRYRREALAALSVGSAVYISVFVALMGVLQALLPVWAELHGARRRGRGRPLGAPVAVPVRRHRSCSAWRCCCCPAPLLRWTEVPDAMQRRGRALPRACWPSPCRRRCCFALFSTLNQSLGKPQLVTWLQLGSLVREGAAVDLVRLRRRSACRRWALVGCAWATLVVNWTHAGLRGVAAAHAAALCSRMRSGSRIEAPDWPQHRASSRGWACRPAWR